MRFANERIVKITVCIRAGRAEGTVQAYCPELPGCSSAARTEEEALSILRKRLQSCLGRPAPAAPATRQLTLEL